MVVAERIEHHRTQLAAHQHGWHVGKRAGTEGKVQPSSRGTPIRTECRLTPLTHEGWHGRFCSHGSRRSRLVFIYVRFVLGQWLARGIREDRRPSLGGYSTQATEHKQLTTQDVLGARVVCAVCGAERRGGRSASASNNAMCILIYRYSNAQSMHWVKFDLWSSGLRVNHSQRLANEKKAW